MKNLLKGLSLMMLFLSFGTLASADIVKVVPEGATDAATETATAAIEEEKKVEGEAAVAVEAVPAEPLTAR